MNMSTNEVIRDFITNEMLHGSLTTPLSDEDQLVESGIIDSLGVMTLLSFLDERFSIQVSGDDLIPENFESVSAIAALIARYRTN
jgi:acyl carrier protein